MNGLTLRISNGRGKKTKNVSGFAPVDVSKFIQEKGAENNIIQNFLKAETAEEQLQLLKTCLSEKNVAENTNSITFLVKFFFNTEAKHPLKCFLARQITKNPSVHQPFTDALCKELIYSVAMPHNTYKDYICVVSKMATCIENFQPGSAAVKIEEISLSRYFDACLRCCVDTLKTRSLSPVEKNEIYNLSHLTLRLVLHIIQKISPANLKQVDSELNSIKNGLQELLFDQDVPMDTKSVCGILVLTVYLVENGQEAWIDLLDPTTEGDQLTILLSNEASQLSLYSAVATIAALDRLQAQTINGESALIVLCKKILDIGESCTSESMITLGVTRTVTQIGKQLDKLSDNEIGLKLIENLLTFVWRHLEHYMDSVRHLTAQLLTSIVKFCSRLDRDGHPEALNNVFTSLASLDTGRKSYYVSLTALANELGATKVFTRLHSLLPQLIEALDQQAVQASATVTLEILLQKHVQEATTETINACWLHYILKYVSSRPLDSSVITILENLLVKAVKLDWNLIKFIKTYISQIDATQDLKCVLIPLTVARQSGLLSQLSSHDNALDKYPNQYDEPQWNGLIYYHTLESAAIHSSEETRILSLSLIVESPKTTETFSEGELNLILYFLKYNINAQSPNFRQLILSLMKKCIKRLEDSFKIVLKQRHLTKKMFYLEFVDKLRDLCFNSLLPGANYSRRFVALQVLVWCDQISLDGQERIWTEEYVEKLLVHLEDSYESNKALALDILNKCPTPLLMRKKYSVSLELDDILKQASSLKPTDCVSAAYKLDLLRTKLPDRILSGGTCSTPEPVAFALLRKLHAALESELSVCERSVVRAAVNAPMYGLLHCMVHLVTKIDVKVIPSSQEWTGVMRAVMSTCEAVSAVVATVVNNSSPEGHLPMDLGGVTDHGNTGGVKLEDGRQVTSQMVLLCAWRSVKEVSLLLGEISSRLLITEEDAPTGTLTPADMTRIGEHFTKLLAETKHRGAFEQAYVGFTKLLTRLWRCRSPLLHALPRRWLDELMALITRGDSGATISTTRRGAGLPFMIQALVTTELQVNGNAKCFHDSMTTLLRLARSPKPTSDSKCKSETDKESRAEKNVPIDQECSDKENESVCKSATDVETRTHCLNILRALFRNSALYESVSGYVEEGLIVALEGFEGRTWMERNASTLLFSALMVRVFGVQRSRSEQLCTRNRMTGRIFFLRYPRLYDFMLAKLQAKSVSAASPVLQPSLYPLLLLLARLYPSSLEGTVSNLKLVAFIPYVSACARSGVVRTRQLAARALAPLVAPHCYLDQLKTTFDIVNDINTNTNYCHGLLLQLTELLSVMPKSSNNLENIFSYRIHTSVWILEQACRDNPCYLLADEWFKMINMFCWKFDFSLIRNSGSCERIESLLETLLNTKTPNVSPGRDVCLSSAAYMYFTLMHNRNLNFGFVHNQLSHPSYEVQLSALNYLLIVYGSFISRICTNRTWMNVFGKVDLENDFEKHLAVITYRQAPDRYKSPDYMRTLSELLQRSKYLECKQKALKLLVMTGDAERYIVGNKINDDSAITDGVIVKTLIDCVGSDHESLTYIYLESLSEFITKKVKQSDATVPPLAMLQVLRTMFEYSTCDRSEQCRSVVAAFMEHNVGYLHQFNLDGLSQEEKLEFKSTLYATILVLLEDDNETLRTGISYSIAALDLLIHHGGNMLPWLPAHEKHSMVISTKSAEVLILHFIKREENQAAVLVACALLDFKSQVCVSDDVGDECRVFDQNEKYNIYAEESVWTDACANQIIQICQQTRTNPTHFVLDIIKSEPYRGVFQKLCNNNVVVFEQMSTGGCSNSPDANPKIRLFIDKLTYTSKTVLSIDVPTLGWINE